MSDTDIERVYRTFNGWAPAFRRASGGDPENAEPEEATAP